MRLTRIAVGATAIAAVAWLVTPGVGSASTVNSAIPRYQHIIEIMMENTSYSTIIGNPLAPQINGLAGKFGLATDYFGVTHPSEPNYVANIGGSFFGIQDDNQFYCTPALASTDPTCAGTTVDHTVSAPNLASQLTAAGRTWRGYFQSLPPVPPSGVIMTGPYADEAGLISAGDSYVGNTVSEIMASKVWQEGRNAIVITWDEDDFSDIGQPSTGCCGADPGGGRVVTIVITNKGEQPITDNTPYNHYSLLRSYEDAFGLPCLASACDAAHGVKPMTPLFHP